MAGEPPQREPLPPPPLPAVADRRAPEGRRAHPRGRPAPLPPADPPTLTRTAAAAALALCGGLAILFLFFWAFGAVDAGDAVVATAVAFVLALVWLGGFLYRRRALEAREVTRRDRERRGF